MKSSMTRRHLLGLITASSAMALAACNSSTGSVATSEKDSSAADRAADATDVEQMLVYRDPECGCCEAWADIARKAGYKVTVENRSDMAEIKARHRVPERLASCHTAIIGGYAIEGHVPMRHIARLLKDRPRDVIGLAVPGMPRGSPGMEMPDGSADPFDVMAFDSKGSSLTFAA